MDGEIWKYPLAKRNIKKAIMDAISESNENFEYVIDRIGYHLTTNTNAIHELDYINKAVDIIRKQEVQMSTTIKLFGHVAILIEICRNT